jgi:hypothetical protein
VNNATTTIKIMTTKYTIPKLITAWAALCLAVLPLSAATFGNFTYREDRTSITITGYSRWATGAVDIPEVIAGKPVTNIGEYAFYNRTGLTSVSIPFSVTRIGDWAFAYCGLNSMSIPTGVTSIGDLAFYNCTFMASVTIPASVTSIGNSAFRDCASLKNVTIPHSVTSIGGSAFWLCDRLEAIIVDPANPNYSSLGGILFSKAQDVLIQYPRGIHGSYSIPSSVTTIDEFAFASCYNLTSVTIPSSVTSIGNSAFSSCVLKSVTIPDSVTSIGDYAFAYGTHYLTTVTIGDSVSTIGERAFHECYRLTSVTIPASVTSMGDRAFSNCYGLTSVIIENGASSIGDEAFYACRNLTSVTIPSSVTSIGDSAFWYCESLTSVKIPRSVTSIGIGVFSQCRSLTSVTIPSSVTNVGSWAFSGCKSLTSVTIPSSVTNIGDGAFKWSSLTTAKFLGNAPVMGLNVFPATSAFMINHILGNTGFTSPKWLGYTCVAISGPPAPEIEVQHPVGNVLVDGRAKKSFGTVVVGSTSANKTFIIKNVGAEVLTLLQAPIDGANPEDFTHSKVRNVTVAPGASVAFQVGFAPTAVGTRSAKVHIQSNDADEGSFDIELTGMGVAP